MGLFVELKLNESFYFRSTHSHTRRRQHSIFDQLKQSTRNLHQFQLADNTDHRHPSIQPLHYRQAFWVKQSVSGGAVRVHTVTALMDCGGGYPGENMFFSFYSITSKRHITLPCPAWIHFNEILIQFAKYNIPGKRI